MDAAYVKTREWQRHKIAKCQDLLGEWDSIVNKIKGSGIDFSGVKLVSYGDGVITDEN